MYIYIYRHVCRYLYLYIYIVYTLCPFLLSPHVFISSVSLSPPNLWWFSFIHQTHEAVLPLARPCQQAVGAPRAQTHYLESIWAPFKCSFSIGIPVTYVFNSVRVFVWYRRKARLFVVQLLNALEWHYWSLSFKKNASGFDSSAQTPIGFLSNRWVDWCLKYRICLRIVYSF